MSRPPSTANAFQVIYPEASSARNAVIPASALYVNAPKPVMSRPTISACMVSVPS
jgi:hypothetical protein